MTSNTDKLIWHSVTETPSKIVNPIHFQNNPGRLRNLREMTSDTRCSTTEYNHQRNTTYLQIKKRRLSYYNISREKDSPVLHNV